MGCWVLLSSFVVELRMGSGSGVTVSGPRSSDLSDLRLL